MTTLARIRTTVRNITGRKSTDQLSNADLDNFINDFYLYDFPERLKTLQLEQFITFTTEPNVDLYTSATYGTNVIFFKPPAYIAGYQIGYMQDPQQFYNLWPDIRFSEQIDTGDGGAAYTGTLSNTPALRNTVLISANDTFGNALSARDDGSGTLTGDVTAGTVNYETGAVSVTFTGNVPVGNAVNAQYWPYVASRPRNVLFFDQQFRFRPVPDQAYEFRIVGQVQPTQLTNAGDSPEFQEWWELIAYGAALKIFIEQSDHEEYARLYPIFREQNNLAMRRALKQMQNQRAQTPYSENQVGVSAYWPIYPLY